MCNIILPAYLPGLVNELQDVLVRCGILLAPGNCAVLIVEGRNIFEVRNCNSCNIIDFSQVWTSLSMKNKIILTTLIPLLSLVLVAGIWS